MYPFPIGVMLDSFRTDVNTALDKAQALGAQGVQIRATFDDLTPAALTAERRKELLKAVKDHGLVVSALCGDLGHGFDDPEKNPALIEESKRILDLAKDLETDVVTTHIGVVPNDKSHPRYAIMQEACGQPGPLRHRDRPRGGRHPQVLPGRAALHRRGGKPGPRQLRHGHWGRPGAGGVHLKGLYRPHPRQGR